jgi:hypothetical protein
MLNNMYTILHIRKSSEDENKDYRMKFNYTPSLLLKNSQLRTSVM